MTVTTNLNRCAFTCERAKIYSLDILAIAIRLSIMLEHYQSGELKGATDKTRALQDDFNQLMDKVGGVND